MILAAGTKNKAKELNLSVPEGAEEYGVGLGYIAWQGTIQSAIGKPH